jgi:hypothetical protein
MRLLFMLIVVATVTACFFKQKAQETRQADEMKQPDFFPIADGMKRDYRITLDGKAADLTVVGTGVEAKDGNRTIKTKIQVGPGGWTEEHMVTEKGLFLVAGANGKCDPPLQLLKYPIKAGDTWAQSYKEGKSTQKPRQRCVRPSPSKLVRASTRNIQLARS